jgi:uncharacterized protein (DUF58 family)
MRRVFVLGAVIYILLVLALAGTNGTLLALMLPFMVYLGFGFFFSPGKFELDINRELSRERAYPGDEIEIFIKITNRGSNLELLKIEDQIPNGLKIIDGENSLLISLSPQESTSLQYTVSGPRGFYHFRYTEISASDSLQVRSKTTKLETDERLFIQPEHLRLGHLQIRPRRTRVYAGHIPAHTGGSGVEFFGVREYQHGDPLRWINWRASARNIQKFFINEFEQERVADVGIILDTRQRSQILLENGASLFEFSVQAASAIADSFLKDGNRVGLLMYGTLLDWTLPDYGKLQQERILQRLATAQPGESLVFGELENLPTRLLPPKSQIVFISPLLKNDLPVLIGLRARGYAVMVISPNPIAFEQVYLSETHKDIQTAVRLAGLERSLMIKRLQQAGIQVLDWHTSVPLDQALVNRLNRPAPLISLSV